MSEPGAWWHRAAPWLVALLPAALAVAVYFPIVGFEFLDYHAAGPTQSSIGRRLPTPSRYDLLVP